MIGTGAAARPPREVRRLRRLEVEHRLAELGLGRSRMPRIFRQAPSPAPPIVRLATALADLGPTFAGFGRYLGVRRDLVGEQDSALLSAIPNRAAAIPPERLAPLLANEFGRPLDEIFAAFEQEPSHVGSFSQRHRARLVSGEVVVVEVVHPDVRGQLPCDLELIDTLPDLLIDEVGHAVPSAAAEGYARYARQASDLERTASNLAALWQESQARGPRIPWVAKQLTTANVLVREWLDGPTLASLYPGRFTPQPLPIDDTDSAQDPIGPRSEDLAGRLTRTWLHQAFRGSRFPIELDADQVVVLPDNRIAWTGGVFAQLAPSAKNGLWSYLVAVANQEPDQAADALLEELDAPPRAEADALRQRFRQVVPFRDGGWASHDDLAGHLFLHWRFANELGYHPRPQLADFYVGLGRLVGQTRRLAWRRDPLLAGIESARIESGFGELGSVIDPQQLGRTAEDYLRMMLTLPDKLDRVLTVAADGRTTVKLDLVEPPEERRRKDATSAVVALLLAMAAVGLVGQHLSTFEGFVPWGERIASGVLIVLGAFLLKALGRRT